LCGARGVFDRLGVTAVSARLTVMTDNCRPVGHVRSDETTQTFRPVNTPNRRGSVQPLDHRLVEFHGDGLPPGGCRRTHDVLRFAVCPT
jgi:hypothetical protein